MTVETRKRKSDKFECTPQAAEDFKRSYAEDEVEITRIFRHMIQKYPCRDGIVEAFNRLFVALLELKVFQRWSVARVVGAEVARRTGDEDKGEKRHQDLLKAGTDEAERAALEMGIDLRAKRGQFLYKWIEHIMGQEYLKDGLRMKRFTSYEPQMSHGTSWQSARREAGFSPWASRAADADPQDYYNGTGAWGIPTNHDSKLFPTFEDTPMCMGEHSFSEATCCVDAGIRRGEIMDTIRSYAKPYDMAVVRGRLQGYTIREIQRQFRHRRSYPHQSHQAIANRLNALKAKTTTRLARAGASA